MISASAFTIGLRLRPDTEEFPSKAVRSKKRDGYKMGEKTRIHG